VYQHSRPSTPQSAQVEGLCGARQHLWRCSSVMIRNPKRASGLSFMVVGMIGTLSIWYQSVFYR
jgi:hypothetical protein